MITPITVNIFYAGLAGLICLMFMILSYWLFDWITPFDTAKQIHNQNQAVGTIIAGIFIGLGIAMGLVIGLSLN